MFLLSVGRAEIAKPEGSRYDESPIGFCPDNCDHFSSETASLWAIWNCETTRFIHTTHRWPAPASQRTFRFVHCSRVPRTAVSRARFAFPWRDARFNCQWHLVGRAYHCADYWHRRFLARPYFAGKDCTQENAPADQGDSMPLPSLTLLWRTALANCMALGLHQAGPAQDGLRHRCG